VTRLLRVLIGVSMLALSLAAGASSIWMSDGARLYATDTLTNRTLPVRTDEPIRALAATTNGGAWVLTDERLLAVAPNGAIETSVELAQLGATDAEFLTVDPYDATLWMAAANRLLHIDPQGTTIASFELTAPIRALALGLDESVWVAEEGGVVNYASDGARLLSVDLKVRPAEVPARVAVDSIGAVVWVAGSTTITRIDLVNGAVTETASPGVIRDLALDPGSGTLWALADDTVTSYDRLGVAATPIGFEKLAPFRLSALALDPSDGTLWLAYTGGVLHIALDGTRLPGPDMAAPVRAIATSPFWIIPRLTLLQPVPGAALANSRPSFELGIDALCSGVPCGKPALSGEIFSLVGAFDGHDVTPQLSRDAFRGQASFTPAQPLSDGSHRFGAHALDRFGHASNPIQVDFSVARESGGNPSNAAALDAVITKAKNQAPAATWVSPATGSTFLPGSSITLSANATDPDGTVSKVDFLSGGTVIGTVTSAPYTYVWNNVPANTYSLTARATDNNGATGTSAPAVTITVAVPQNNPPSVAITAPADGATFSAPASITISANASDTDGTVAKIDFYDGSQLVGTVNGSAVTLTGSATDNVLSPGLHALKAVATDNLGATGTAVVNITVNAPPLVVLLAPAACSVWQAPASFQPTAEAAAPSGTISRVEFYQNGTLIGSTTYHIVDSYTLTFPWNNVLAGTYVLTAKAYDNAGLSTTSAPITITVAAPNNPPAVTLTAPANGAAFRAPATVNLAATVSDSDGTVSKVEFYQGTTLIGIATAAPFTATWSNVAAGSYTITAKATDNLGAATTSAPSTITVNANVPPTVALTAPASGAIYFAPATITLTASASDADGNVVRVDFYNGGTLIGTATNSPFSVAWTNVASGTYTVTAQATDNGGAITTSSPITVVVDGVAATVTSPVDGTSIGDDNVLVTGTVQAPTNSAVFVNGIAAAVDASGNFFVNNVPLQSGANPITVAVTTLDNAPATQTINATSTGAAPFTVSVDPQDGFAPLTTSLTIVDRATVPFQRIDIDTNNDGTPEASLTSLPGSGPAATVTYPVAGTYTMKITAYDANNSVIYSTLRMVRAFDPAERATLLTQVYNDMLDRLRAGNIAGALNAFSPSVQPTYQSIFSQLGSNLPAVIGQFGGVDSATFGLDFGELIVTMPMPDGTYAYPIDLVRGYDGLWRIEGM
jgi:hypothetical protein